MTLDDLQQRWQAQERKIDQLLSINTQLLLRADMAARRTLLRRSRLANVFEMLCGVICLSWTGSFLYTHISELRFVVPAAALHLWVIGAVIAAGVRFIRTGTIDYGAPIVQIQNQLESLRLFAQRAVWLLLLTGIPIWFVPFGIVAFRSWFNVDLYAVVPGKILLVQFAASVLLALIVAKVCAYFATRMQHSPRLRRIVRTFGGYNLAVAQDKLAKLAQFERE